MPTNTAGEQFPYIIKKRKDGVICIYSSKVNVVLAEFVKGASVDAERISDLFLKEAARKTEMTK